MKYILVSGASGGIGKKCVEELLKSGYFVIGLDKLDSNIVDKNYRHFKCDLANHNSINLTVFKIHSLTNKIDTIINVAGIFMLQSIVEGSEEDLKKIIDVNFFGVYRTNKAFLPFLDVKSKIIIFTSEVARYSPQPFNGYYALSKIIVDKYCDVLRRELNYLKIKVIKIQSGAIKTNLLKGVNAKYKEMLDNSKKYKEPLRKLKKLMDDEITKEIDPDVIAKKIVKIVGKNNPKIVYKIKNSFKLRFLNSLPEKMQDSIYIKVIK